MQNQAGEVCVADCSESSLCCSGSGALPRAGAVLVPGALRRVEHEPCVSPAALLATSALENSAVCENLLATYICRLLLIQLCPNSEKAGGRSCSIYALW